MDLINVTALVRERFGNALSRYRKTLYYSYHTTAGYLDQQICQRLNHDFNSLRSFVGSYQRLFPQNADYRHDQLELRTELTDAERRDEPRNADAHLTFIGSGLSNLVTYTSSDLPVYFIDLDGTNGEAKRTRQTTVLGFDRDKFVDQRVLPVPVSNHPMDSINLNDKGLGLIDELNLMLERFEVRRGRFDISLETNEQSAGLTVNEYETLLMKHDLIEVLRNPLRFMAEKGKHMFLDPRSIPLKAKEYAKYDLVQIVNEFIDATGLSESVVERVIHRFLAVPASRFLRMKRSISLLALEQGDSYPARIVEGMYQSPVLVQWRRAKGQTRSLRVSLVRFD